MTVGKCRRNINTSAISHPWKNATNMIVSAYLSKQKGKSSGSSKEEGGHEQLWADLELRIHGA